MSNQLGPYSDYNERSHRPDSHARQYEAQYAADVEGSGEEPTFTRSLLGDSRLAGRGNSPLHQAAMQQMQQTHGNRAVQRHVAGGASNERVAVQRTPTDTLESLKTMMGEGPGFEYMKRQMGMEPGQAMHTLETLRKMGQEGPGLDWMAGQMGMYGVGGKPNGPYAEGGENEAGGYEGRFRANGDKSGWVDSDAGFGEGAVGAWDEDGGRQYGIKGKVGVARSKINEGGFVSGEWEAGTAGAEFSYGDNGIRAQAGATGVGGAVTVGNFDKESDTDTQIRAGLSAGPSLGLRVHWGDSDGDGVPEIGAGVDIGPLSLDSKSERAMAMNMAVAEKYWDMYDSMTDLSPDTVLDAMQDPLGSATKYFTSDSGPSEAEQQKNQQAFIAKRDKELADLEKNKEKIMKEQGPQAYYHKMTLANSPPQVRALIEN